jgi:hypothetical protein
MTLRSKNIAIGFTFTFAGLWLVVNLIASGAIVTSKIVRTSGVIGAANLGLYSDDSCTKSFQPTILLSSKYQYTIHETLQSLPQARIRT